MRYHLVSSTSLVSEPLLPPPAGFPARENPGCSHGGEGGQAEAGGEEKASKYR